MMWLILAGALIYLNYPLDTHLGETFCHVANFCIVLGVSHGLTGGLGIAVMRIIFVVYSTRLSLGQHKTAICISLISLTCSFSGTVVWVTAPKTSLDVTSICLGRCSHYHKTLFDYYSDHSVSYENTLVAHGLILIAFLTVLTKLTIYVSIYKFIANHDKSMILVLREDDIQKRLRKNVIDLSGHVVNFAVETSLVITCVVGGHLIPPNYKWILLLYQVSFYGLVCTFHIGFSQPLRADFKKLTKYLLFQDPDE